MQGYTTTNISNSIATLLITALNTRGFAVYSLQSDSLIVPGHVQGEYAAQALAQQLDAAVIAFQQTPGYRGILTLTDKDPAESLYPMRPTTDGTVAGPGGITVPLLALDVGPVEQGGLWELGSKLRERERTLMLYGFARNNDEAVWLTDVLTELFDVSTLVDVVDHDMETLAPIGTIEITRSTPGRQVVHRAGDVTAYEVMLAATVWYLV